MALAGVLALAALIAWRRRRHARRQPRIARPAASGEPERPSPWRAFKDRLLRLPPGQPWVRRAVVMTAALIIVAGAFLTAPALPGATVLAAGRVETVSRAVLAIGVVLSAVAWALVLAGLFLAKWPVRLAGLGILGVGAAAEWHAMGARLSLFGGAAGLAATAGVFALGLITVAADVWSRRAGKRVDPRSRPWVGVVAAALAVLVLTVFLNQAVRLGGLGSIGQASASVIDLLSVTAIVIVPMLLVAGADVADFGAAVAGGIGGALGTRVVPIAALAGATAVAVAARSLGAQPLGGMLLAAGTAAAVAGLRPALPRAWPAQAPGRQVSHPGEPSQPGEPAESGGSGRPGTSGESGERGRPELPTSALICAALVFWALIALQIATGLLPVPASSALSFVRLDRPFTASVQPAFSFRYPGACRVADSSGPVLASVTIGPCAPARGQASVLGLSFSYAVLGSAFVAPDPCADMRSVYPSALYLPGPDAAGWRACRIRLAAGRGIAWTRRVGDRTWLLFGETSAGQYPFTEPLLQAIRDSWRLGARPGPPVGGAADGPDRYPAALTAGVALRAGLVWAAIAVGGIVMIWRRAPTGRGGLGALYLTATAVWVAAGFLAGAAGISGSAGHSGFGLPVVGVLALAGLGTLWYALISVVRGRRGGRARQGREPGLRAADSRRLASLLGLDAGLLLIWGAGALYASASRIEETQVTLGALVIVAALLWDLVFSGPMLNPARPEHAQDPAAAQRADEKAARSPLPPRARILMYSGYLLLTASAVLQIGTLRAPVTGAPLLAFDSEQLVRVGIAELGVPLALTAFMIGWRGPACATDAGPKAAEPA